jgi:CoA-dependent NAD(P)H sulfur oxidoreductase
MKLVVIGGVAAGPSAAAKAKRSNPDLEVTVFERSGHVSFGACGLPYVIGGDVPRFEDLVARTPEAFAKQGIKVMTRHEVTKVDYAGRQLEVRDHLENRTFNESFDKLVIATGANPIRPKLDGIELEHIFTLRDIEDGEAIQRAIHEVKKIKRQPKVVIVGGGYIGLEMAEAFQKRGLHVTVIEKLPHLLGYVGQEIALKTLEELGRHGVEVLLGQQVTGFSGTGRVEKVHTSHGDLEADIVLLALGVQPNSGLASSFGVALTPFGSVQVNERCETNLPGVYAAGDLTEVHHIVSGRHAYVPLGSTANKQGRVVGMNIAGASATFEGVVGTAVSKVFDLGVAVTGLSELEAAMMDLETNTVIVEAPDQARYCPGSKLLTVKLLYQPRDGKLLGAQIAGQIEAVKRIDVVASLLHRGGTVEDLSRLDLAYAPPFSPVWDPLLVAANQAL